MNKNIEVIEDNAGGLTIQNTETKAVCFFDHKDGAIESLRGILDGDDMSGWDTSEPEHYITDEAFAEYEQTGGYTAWSKEDIEEFVA